MAGGKVLEILKKQIFRKKHFFTKKKENVFFSKKTKFLFIGLNKFFSPKKTFFCQKLSVR